MAREKMKSFKGYCITEHPTLASRILKKINPLEKLKDKMDDLKDMPGKLKAKAMKKLKDKIDKVNPMSAVNKMATMNTKDKIASLRKKKSAIGDDIKQLQRKIKPK